MENSRFQKRKSETLAAISSPLPDKSPKGSLDTPIIPLITAVNSHPSFFTTSSCSGRISILSHPSSSPSSSTSKKKARGGTWLFVSHDFVDPDDVVPLLFGSESQPDSDSDLVFRFEPLIIAVECADIEAAQLLVSTAVSCGFRESGITSVQKRVIIGIRCSIRMEVPLGQVGKVMVSEEYVRYLVGIANEKMEANRSRTDGLLRVLQDKVLSGPVKHIDSYEMKKGRVSDKGSQLHLEAEHAHLGAHKSTDLFCEGSSEDLNLLNELEVGYNKKEISKQDPNPELSGTPACSISVNTLMIVGEPIEKLFLWGHSACTLNGKKTKEIIIFGGFGGLGRHARRNYSLMLDLQLGKLNEIDACGSPSPRLGHTSSVVGDKFFVIGGREGPTQILNDVWVLQLSENRWQLLECTGSIFHPRHRHVAVAVGSNIYVFGGLNGEVIYSSMHILNTDTSQWTEVSTQGEWPFPRHSNSLVAYGSLLFMFGGYNGEKAIGDLYCFDIKTCLWEKVNTSGRAPSPRFSHCMFIYKHYLGIVGGCPIRKQNQELSLLNLEHNIWVHVKVDSVDRDLWVRSSTIVIDDSLVIIGGGTSCYAFGTKFNKPIKINLEPIDSLHGVASDKENKPPTELVDAKYYVLQVEKKYAKLAKDVLKKFGWLDLTRKVQPRQDDCNIHFPVVKSFYSLFQKELLSVDTTDDFYLQDIFAKKGLALNEVSIPVALRFLVSCGSSLQISDASYVKKASKTPQNLLNESVCSLLREKELPPKLLDQLPLRWERLGDIVVLPVNSFKDPIWDSIGNELWPIVAKSLGAQRLARQGRILPTGTRDSTLEILVGDGGWVTHQENGILYSLDATKCMFSSGNHSEKLRMAHLNCTDEVVVDLFAGIGYFVLPFLVKAKAKLVYACEWNPQAIEALQHNIKANFVAERCTILEGDNRVTAPKGVANRVCLGLLPSSEGSWATAVRALRVEGGVLHIHENVKDSEEKSWLEHVLQSIGSIAQSEGLHWDVSIQHVERVKWYGPHIRHIVADVKCQQLET